MKTVTVSASKQYQVVIGEDLLGNTAKYISDLNISSKIAIISDSNVWPLYGEKVVRSLTTAGFEVCHFAFRAGETSKNGTTYLSILNFLAKNQLTRSDLVIALGGGVVGDVTGFAAATYLRGISYIQIPTTLLSMVDSSVGGKTAIDLELGKNLVGAFYQPSLVLCDISTLNTLSDCIFKDGCAEVIKYGILYDPALFAHLQEKNTSFDREYVVSRCVELKRDVVVKDEFDNGMRQMLNLGHTIGHSIEKGTGYAVTHGYAVAAGIAIISRLSAKQGFCAKQALDRILALLKAFDLPTSTELSPKNLAEHALSDKKRNGNTVNLIIPKAIGECIILPTPVEKICSYIEAGI